STVGTQHVIGTSAITTATNASPLCSEADGVATPLGVCESAQLSSQPHSGRASHGSRHRSSLALTANCGWRQSAVRALKHCWLPANARVRVCAGSARLANPALLSFALTPILGLAVSRQSAAPWKARWQWLA